MKIKRLLFITHLSRVLPFPVCGRVQVYNERSLHTKFCSQGIQTSFYESTPTTQDPVGNTISPRPPGSTGNVRANIPDASEECRILFKCFLARKVSGGCMTSSNRLKATERSHFHTSLLYVGLHYKLSEYRKKRRLRVQNRSAGCILSCTNPSRQQEVPTF